MQFASCLAATPGQASVNRFQQVLHHHWLGQEIRSTELFCLINGVVITVTGNQDHRNRRGSLVGAHQRKQVHAAHKGQPVTVISGRFGQIMCPWARFGGMVPPRLKDVLVPQTVLVGRQVAGYRRAARGHLHHRRLRAFKFASCQASHCRAPSGFRRFLYSNWRSAIPAKSRSRPDGSAATTCAKSRSPKLWRSKAPKTTVLGSGGTLQDFLRDMDRSMLGRTDPRRRRTRPD